MTTTTYFFNDDDGKGRRLRGRPSAVSPISPMPADMRNFPNVSRSTRRAHGKFIGAAGEYLVDSILTRYGLVPWTAPDLHRADRLIEVCGQAVLVQIKTISAPANGVCSFLMQHGNAHAGKGIRPYAEDAFNIAALVVLSHNAVKFVPNVARSFRLFDSELPDLVNDPVKSLEFSICACLRRETRRFI